MTQWIKATTVILESFEPAMNKLGFVHSWTNCTQASTAIAFCSNKATVFCTVDERERQLAVCIFDDIIDVPEKYKFDLVGESILTLSRRNHLTFINCYEALLLSKRLISPENGSFKEDIETIAKLSSKALFEFCSANVTLGDYKKNNAIIKQSLWPCFLQILLKTKNLRCLKD